ncbi:TMEM175 family protein [Enterococcus faecalis]
MTKGRLEAFTDAIIAIVMTILVLELHQPQADTWAALFDLRQKILIYIMSFVILAIYWHNHHHMFQLVKKVNGRILWANSFFIFVLTLYPFATAWVGDHLASQAPELTYGTVILVGNVVYLFLMKELVRANGKESSLGHLFQRYIKSYLSIGLNVLALLLGYFFHPYFVLVINVIILVLWVIPDRRVEQATS